MSWIETRSHLQKQHAVSICLATLRLLSWLAHYYLGQMPTFSPNRLRLTMEKLWYSTASLFPVASHTSCQLQPLVYFYMRLGISCHSGVICCMLVWQWDLWAKDTVSFGRKCLRLEFTGLTSLYSIMVSYIIGVVGL